MNLVLDTNIYSAWRRGDPRVRPYIAGAERLLLPAVVVGELLSGFRLGSRLQGNLGDLRAALDLANVELVDISMQTADRYGRIDAILRRRGRPIPTNDVWIAATASEQDAYLLSFDRHFAAVPGIEWIDPARP